MTDPLLEKRIADLEMQLARQTAEAEYRSFGLYIGIGVMVLRLLFGGRRNAEKNTRQS